MQRAGALTPVGPRSILVDSSKKSRSDVGELSGGSRPRSGSRQHISTNIGCRGLHCSVCFAFCLIVAVVLLLAILLASHAGSSRHHTPCWTESCKAYIVALASSINASRDPCHDFHGYVCDRWQPTAGGRTVLEDAMFAFQSKVADKAIKTQIPQTSQSASEKTAALYQSCVRTDTRDKEGLDDFRRFLKDRRLPWPLAETEVDVLDVLFELTLNWHFPVFFHAHLLVAPSTSARLVFTDTFLGLGPRTLLEERKLRNNNTELICLLGDALKERDEYPDWGKEACESLDKYQETVLVSLAEKDALENSQSWASYNSLNTFIQDIASRLPVSRWVMSIGKKLQGPGNVSSESPVQTSSPRHMTKVSKLLNEEQRTRLLRLVGLNVVQGLGRFASSRLAALIYGATSDMSRRHQSLCYALVNKLALRWLSARDVWLLFDTPRVAKVADVFAAVQLSLSNTLRNATWLAEDPRTRARRILNESSLLYEAALTGEAGGHEAKPNAAIGMLPDFSDKFLDNVARIPPGYWNEIHRGMTPPSKHDYEEEQLAWALRESAEARWEDLWQQACLSSRGAVLPDLYMLESIFPQGAYESVNYGVVGYLLTRQLLATLLTSRPEWRLWRLNDSVRCVQESYAQQESNVIQLDDSHLLALFGAAASMQPLHEALLRSAGYPDWSQGFQDYTADQLFFLALSFPTCGMREYGAEAKPSPASFCNVPLKLSHQFAQAFGCKLGENMYPKLGCFSW